MNIEQIRLRLGEMAAEVERLTAENARLQQIEIGDGAVDSFEKFAATFDLNSNAWLDMDAQTTFTSGYNRGFLAGRSVEQQSPSWKLGKMNGGKIVEQSPAVPNGVYENKCSCGSFFFGAKNQPFCAKCYDDKLRGRQSPAVAVPASVDIGFIEDCLIAYKSGLYFDGAEGLRNKIDQQLSAIKQQSPRITEQDDNAAPNEILSLAMDQNWSMYQCVQKLIDSANILLYERDYDGHGHELIREAKVCAETYIRNFNPFNSNNQHRITEQELREIAESVFGLFGDLREDEYQLWMEKHGSAILDKIKGDKNAQ